MPVSDELQELDSFMDCEPQSDPRWIVLERVLASRQFAKSARLSSFLRYIGVSTLEGRQDEITEQQIGHHVFERPSHYNSAEDNIVRTSARQLRQRLAMYYQEDGRSDEIRIDVPRGGYVPVFETRSPESSPVPISPDPVSPDPLPVPLEDSPDSSAVGVMERNIESSRLMAAPFFLIAVGLLLGIGSTILLQHWISSRNHRSSVSHVLWSSIFTSSLPTVFVPGDAGLTMYDNLARTQVSVADYMTGVYLREPAAQTPSGYRWTPFAERRYVSIVDLQFTDHLRALPEFRAEQYSIRYARDLHVTDFRDCNLILVGGPIHNPWVEVFDKNLNFHFAYDGPTNVVQVVNRAPQKGESSLYSWSPDNSTRGYADIALVDNLHDGGKVLLVQGTTMGAVDAAETFLLNDSRMTKVLQQAQAGRQRLNNFELLLEADVIDGISLHTTLIATRFHPAS